MIGLSKSVVEGTLSKVKAAIEDETKLKLTVQSDLVFITGEFEMMQSFLNVADAGERIKNKAVKTWVRQLRDLAYDAEDCIELVIHLDPKPSWWRRLLILPCLPAVTLPIDDAAAEIKELKDRVEYVSQRNMRYNLIADFGSGANIKSAAVQLDLERRRLDISIPVEEAKNKGSLVIDLTELIPNTEDHPDLGVISVWGTGGDLGVASIIRKAYDDSEIRNNFQCRGWAKLTHPFNPLKILRSLLIQFCTNTSTGPPNRQGEALDADSLPRTVASEGQVIREFVNHVNTKRYLVVLEDLSTIAEWDALRIYLPDRGNGSHVIVSTQHFDVASLCVGQPHKVSEFRKFTPDHSVYVFSKEVIGAGDVGCDADDLIGRDTEKVELINQIDEVSCVISVWGIAGVGKSALVRSVYRKYLNDRTKDSRSYINAWVNVPSPFNLRELCRSLLLHMSSVPATTKQVAAAQLANLTNPIDLCRRLLSGDTRCLIVIDGLQSTQEWDNIKQALSFGKASCIILVTNELSVANHCSGRDQFVLNVKGLADDHATQLFNKELEKQHNPIVPDDMEEQTKLIVNRCGGLPKLIVSVACFLAKNVDWEATNSNFIQQLESNQELASVRSIFGWLDSYFHTCPDFLKPCIFYLSIFPPRHGIRRRRLVRRWIAEGYARDTDGNLAEVNGEDYLSRLVDHSMLATAGKAGTGTETGRQMAKCYVNDFFREYIVSRRMEEDHVFALEGRCSQTTRRTGRHLVIHGSWDRDENVFNRIDFSRLRSLTVFGDCWEPFFTSDKMRVLRVLDLEGVTEGLTDDDIKNMVKRLPRLKFLSLRGCKGISRLPESLGRLRQLETLDIRNTAISWLPDTIVKMKKLQYVRAGVKGHTSASNNATSWVSSCLSCRPVGDQAVGVEVPCGFDELTNLHTLGVIKATAAGLIELRKLSQLRKLGVSGINRKNHEELRAVVSGHGHLESLSVWLDKADKQGFNDRVLDTVDEFKRPEKLRRLKLCGHLEELPVWIQDLTKLDNLHVSKTPAQDPSLPVT